MGSDHYKVRNKPCFLVHFWYKSSIISDTLIHISYTMNCYIWLHGKKIVKEKIMNNKNLRNGIRTIHLIAAATLGIYFYSPIAGDVTLKLIIQFVTLPSIVLTGIAMWQQAYLNKLLNRNPRKSTTSSTRSMPAD